MIEVLQNCDCLLLLAEVLKLSFAKEIMDFSRKDENIYICSVAVCIVMTFYITFIRKCGFVRQWKIGFSHSKFSAPQMKNLKYLSYIANIMDPTFVLN